MRYGRRLMIAAKTAMSSLVTIATLSGVLGFCIFRTSWLAERERERDA